MVDIATLVTGIIVLFLAAVIIVVMVAIALRASRQRVSVRGGRLVTNAGIGAEQSIPAYDIGTVLFVRESETRDARYKFGVLDYGGLLFLDLGGRLVRIIRHFPGSDLPLRPIFDQVAARERVDFAGRTRADLVKGYPRALGFWQLRGQLFWAFTITILLLVLLAIVLPLVGFAITLIAG